MGLACRLSAAKLLLLLLLLDLLPLVTAKFVCGDWWFGVVAFGGGAIVVATGAPRPAIGNNIGLSAQVPGVARPAVCTIPFIIGCAC